MKYDYKKAELFYIRHKGATLKSCSERYSIPFSSLSKRAGDGKWTDKRRKYWEDIANKSKERSAESEVNKLASIARASERAAEILEKALNSPEQFYKYLIEINDGNGNVETVEREYSKLDSKSIREIVSALKDLVSVIRNVDEIPTSGEKFARRIQAERWDVERRRMESEISKYDADDGIVVEFKEKAEGMSE